MHTCEGDNKIIMQHAQCATWVHPAWFFCLFLLFVKYDFVESVLGLLPVTSSKPWACRPGLGFQNPKPGQMFWLDEGFGPAQPGFSGPGLAWLRA